MTALLIALIPIALVAGFLVGVSYGVKATRTTDGRHRFGGHVVEPPVVGDVHIHHNAPSIEHPRFRADPQTVGLPRVDGSLPRRGSSAPKGPGQMFVTNAPQPPVQDRIPDAPPRAQTAVMPMGNSHVPGATW